MNLHNYKINEEYKTSVAYFSMEFAIDQALKTYSGGLGFLSGSHMRSAYDLGQNVIGVGMLWSYGYYDQAWGEHRTLKATFLRKRYYFLEDLNIEVKLNINNHPVYVKAFLLKSETFGTAPIIFLTTDYEKNDHLACTISHKLYDVYEDTRIAQETVLGIGGVKVLEALNQKIDIYHLNEGHALPLAFELYKKYNSVDEIRNHIVFTTHTPEKAGNEEHNIYKLKQMGFFGDLSIDKVKELTQTNDDFSLTLGALRVSKIANGVSKLHAVVSNDMWSSYNNIAPIIAITNAQNKKYWVDTIMDNALINNQDDILLDRKRHLKERLFKIVADQTGKLFDPDILTIVWARRFAEYKRPNILAYDLEIFKRLVTNSDKPIQIIWAGKPYPFDMNAIHIFNELNHLSINYGNVAVLLGYELSLSALLKKGSDIWLNTPRVTREASGTSGMTASMNGAINFSINDGWIPEFSKDEVNSFIIPSNSNLDIATQDKQDYTNMINILENKIIPLYYDNKDEWLKIMKNSMRDIIPYFDANRMANDYYTKMYNF
ncbi:MAG: alpha-glucan family phosphorylase [Sulfurovaceae bacterium]|nr:alpha-glucan family phosphorylase [Sulfurovaceae bacterium]